MRSQAERRRSTGLKLPVLRIPQGQAKQMSHAFSVHAYTQPGSGAIHLKLAQSSVSTVDKTGFDYPYLQVYF